MIYLLLKIELQELFLKCKIVLIHLKVKFAKLWFNITNLKRVMRFKKLENKLDIGLRKQNLEQAILIKEIQVLIPKKVKKGLSQYIPLTKASRAKIKAIILSNFGERMQKANLTINDNLQIA